MVLLIAELVARAAETNRLRIPHPTRHHALKPLDETQQEGWGDQQVYMAVNSLGMRDRSPRRVPLRRPEATRILFLGDSFTEGVGVSYEETFVDQVERRLAGRLLRPPECLDAGVASYSPLLEFITLKELLDAGLSVDGVVLALDGSDPQDEVLYRAYLGAAYERALGESAAPFHSAMFVGLYRRSALFRRLAFRQSTRALERATASVWRTGYNEDREVWHYDPDLIMRWGRTGLDLMKANVTRIQDFLSRRSIPLIVLLYPRPIEIERGEASDYETDLRGLIERRGLCAVDLYPVFRARTDWRDLFIPRDVHWTPRGHAVVAKVLSAAIGAGARGEGCFVLR